jgi:hypothetical protein
MVKGITAGIIVPLLLTIGMPIIENNSNEIISKGSTSMQVNLLSTRQAYAAVNGWTSSGGYWYYGVNGQYVTGWQRIYHSQRWDWFFFLNDGRMATDWMVWDNSWFYLAETKGQGYGFNDPMYGTMREGWQYIWHSTGPDWFYFHGNGSGRMKTGWHDEGGYRYYFGDDTVGYSFNNPAHGTMLMDTYKIGAYYYEFKSERSVGINYPLGAMFKNMAYVVFLLPNGGPILGVGWIDEYGHANLYGIQSATQSQLDGLPTYDDEALGYLDNPRNAKSDKNIDHVPSAPDDEPNISEPFVDIPSANEQVDETTGSYEPNIDSPSTIDQSVDKGVATNEPIVDMPDASCQSDDVIIIANQNVEEM